MNTPTLSALWTLAGEDGTLLPAAVAGVTGIVRRRATGSTETCTVRLDGAAFDTSPRFACGSTVTIRRGGVPWFVGRVTTVPGHGDGRSEGIGYDLSGPWWYLENLVCQQTWTLQGGDTTGLLSRLILGQSLAGDRLTSGQIIAETVQYAIDAGAPMQLGVIEPAALLPLDELRDVTCAEVIRKVLRWHPDCVAWFDHGTSPVPTFHCRARASLPPVTYTVGQAPLAAVRGVTARTDLLTPAVVLHYETGDADSLDVLTDAAPPGATGREFGALVATIPVDASGIPATDDTHRLRALTDLPTGGAPTTASLAATLYAARSVLTYGGSVVLVEAEAGGTAAGLGTTLNLADTARPEWAAMRALVVEDETDVGSGTTTVRFGPAETLGAGDLAAALSVTRPGVGGREANSPAAMWTRSSTARVNGRST